MQEYWLMRNTGQWCPHLQILLPSWVLGPKPGEHPSQAAALASHHIQNRPAARLVRRGGQPRGKRKRLLLTIHSELALAIKTTELPRAGAPPSHLASSPICTNRLCCGQEREESWTWGNGQQAENKRETPSTPQRNIHFRGGLCDTRGSSTKCTSLHNRDHGVIHGFIRYSVNGYGLLFGVV